MRSYEYAACPETKGAFSKKLFSLFWIFLFVPLGSASAPQELKFHHMIADLIRPSLYALDPGTRSENKATVFVINAETEKIENRIEVPRCLWNISLNYAENRLYGSGGFKGVSVIDLATQTTLPDLQLPFVVNWVPGARAGRIVCYTACPVCPQ